MRSILHPRLDVLLPPQLAVWQWLREVPPDFVLYGGTALALRLGHRVSVDFDFFSNSRFDPGHLKDRIPLLRQGTPVQSAPHTLSVLIDAGGGGGSVKLSFFGGLDMKRVGTPQRTADTQLQVADLLDLGGTKVLTVQDRAEAKDYQDIAAVLEAGVDLPHMLAAAESIFGSSFNAGITLKALNYFEDGDLPTLSRAVRRRLQRAALPVETLPDVPAVSSRLYDTQIQ